MLVERERRGEISIGFAEGKDTKALGTGQRIIDKREVRSIGEGGVVRECFCNFSEPTFTALFQCLSDRQMQFSPVPRKQALVNGVPL